MFEFDFVIGAVIGVIAAIPIGFFLGRKDGTEIGQAIADSALAKLGCPVEAVIKRSSDGRWRMAVEPYSEAAEHDADWITTGDGFATHEEARELARKYWPDCKFAIDYGEGSHGS